MPLNRILGVVDLLGGSVAAVDDLITRGIPGLKPPAALAVQSAEMAVSGDRSGVSILPDGQPGLIATIVRLDGHPSVPRGGIHDHVSNLFRLHGTAVADTLAGDWALAAWRADRRELVIVRAQTGGPPIFYVRRGSRLLFATEVSVLRSLLTQRQEIDESEFTMGVAGLGDRSDRTLVAGVRRLLPGHWLTANVSGLTVRRYWHTADVPPLTLSTPADYAAGLRASITAAVRDRLPQTGGVATHLSAGLDSGTVTTIAARLLAADDRKVHAFTSSPTDDCSAFHDPKFNIDEWPLASSTAASSPNIVHHRVSGTELTPIGAMRRWHEAGGEPVRNPGALRWVLAISDAAIEIGASTLLTGSIGNAALSWQGPQPPRPRPMDLRGLAARTRSAVGAQLPDAAMARILARRDPQWHRTSAVHPRLAANAVGRATLVAHRSSDDGRAGQRTLVERIVNGIDGAHSGRIHGVETLDPTSDIRVIQCALSVPIELFRDRSTGVGRDLIRKATIGLLPDAVRLNRRLGLQGPDLVLRLREDASEVDAALDELRTGPAADYLDVGHMQDAWSYARDHDDQQAHRVATQVLMRGIGFGLWANDNAG